MVGSTRWRGLAYENGGFWIGLLRGWRANYAVQPIAMFVSYGFLHGGIIHLVINMVTLFPISGLAVSRIGPYRFVLLYFISLIGGGVGFAILSDSIQPMVGASGALFGLAGAIAAWDYVDRYSAKLELWPVAWLITFLIGLNFVLWWLTSGQLAWETHLGGFVFGWITALLVDPRSRPID
ncbi:MAG: rhomboid family intramembrane serine protease [Paracoccaceae bacterium]